VITSLRRAPIARSRMKERRRGLKVRPYHAAGTRQGLIKELDRLTSLIVRKRDGKCLTCGSTESLECSHFYKRRFHSTRWSLDNCHAQCSRCNQLHNVKPFPYLFALQEKIGKDAVLELLALRDSGKHFTDAELQGLISEYKVILKNTQGGNFSD
jgi:Bacteriophage Lambda NinG protein